MYIVPNTDKEDPYYKKFLAEEQFMQDYKKRTGYPWLAHYPRDPPILPMWSTEYIGQIHYVTSNQSYWHCFPDAEDEEAMKNCRDTESINFEIKVVSQKPKVFTIQNVCKENI